MPCNFQTAMTEWGILQLHGLALITLNKAGPVRGEAGGSGGSVCACWVAADATFLGGSPHTIQMPVVKNTRGCIHTHTHAATPLPDQLDSSCLKDSAAQWRQCGQIS